MLVAATDVHPFEATISVVGTIVAGVVALTLFFRLLSWFDRSSDDAISRVDIAKALETDAQVTATVHLGGGKSFENVRIIGVTGSGNGKAIPIWQLSDMLILQHEDASRTLVHAKSVRMIEIPSVRE